MQEKLEELEKANVSVICIDLLQNVESRLDPLILISYYDIGISSQLMLLWLFGRPTFLSFFGLTSKWTLTVRLELFVVAKSNRDRSNQYAANHNDDFIESKSDRQMLLLMKEKIIDELGN
ncbi:hypothetical protein Ahy_B07g088674 isoform A [Arachis hypogaea]|uniref:Uncharacterized protein n=1 Tax=Arachis hypogaea TaxID=3818 RepID=A0A444YF53_ARAHY|nr:hypothetical protein Ahy_B07g088674 isoform A [Arachis hypogaea]